MPDSTNKAKLFSHIASEISYSVRAMCLLAATILTAACADRTDNHQAPTTITPMDPLMADSDLSDNDASEPLNKSIYWVGHSLMETSAETAEGAFTLMDMVKRFAESRGLGYSADQQLLFGAPLSLHWRGKTHSYKREVIEAKRRREAFQQKAAQYNTLVITDTVPIGPTAKYEHSHYYWQQFYCTMQQQNPNAKVYVYEGWRYYFGSDQHENTGKYQDPREWREQMSSDAKIWRQLAEGTVNRPAPDPSRLQRLLNQIAPSTHPCPNGTAITIIPVGSLMAQAYDALTNENTAPQLLNGKPLAMIDWFDNPWSNWPQTTTETLRAVDEARPMDDIHPSSIGVYFAALVHFAVLYNQSVQGLPDIAGLGTETSEWLQNLVDRSLQ